MYKCCAKIKTNNNTQYDMKTNSEIFFFLVSNGIFCVGIRMTWYHVIGLDYKV